MTKATIDDIDVAGRRVLLRTDFNVPFSDGEIGDDRRIREALPTLEALRDRGARTTIVTHLGRPRGLVVPKLSVVPIAARLAELLHAPVAVARDVAGPSAQLTVDRLRDGEVAMLENVRFEPGEEANASALAERLASFGDVFVNDAFGTAHRAHASTAGVARYLPAVAGLLMARELDVLGSVLHDARAPVVAILGGSKISTKLGVLRNLLGRVDSMHVGGAMACTFFRARGVSTGRSLVEEDLVGVAAGLLESAVGSRCTLHFPLDVVVAAGPSSDYEPTIVPWDAIPDDAMVVDIGPRSVAAIAADVATAGTVVWNGPLGIYEVEEFARATRMVARKVGESRAVTVIGGGDLGAAVEDAGVADCIDFISTGGGATLEFLEGRLLPGVEALRDRTAVAP